MVSNKEQFQDFSAGEETGGVHPGAVVNTQFVFHEGYNSARSENTVTYVAAFDGNKCQLSCRKRQRPNSV